MVDGARRRRKRAAARLAAPLPGECTMDGLDALPIEIRMLAWAIALGLAHLLLAAALMTRGWWTAMPSWFAPICRPAISG